MKLIALTVGLVVVGLVSLFVPALSQVYTVASCTLLVGVAVGAVYSLSSASENEVSEEAVHTQIARSKIKLLESDIIQLQKELYAQQRQGYPVSVPQERKGHAVSASNAEWGHAKNRACVGRS